MYYWLQDSQKVLSVLPDIRMYVSVRFYLLLPLIEDTTLRKDNIITFAFKKKYFTT